MLCCDSEGKIERKPENGGRLLLKDSKRRPNCSERYAVCLVRVSQTVRKAREGERACDMRAKQLIGDSLNS